MEKEVRTVARETIIKHEGFRSKPYKDTVGKLTIGFGRNLEDVGISWAEAMFMLENDLARIEADLEDFFGKDWKDLPLYIKVVLMDMCYNLGFRGFRSFRKMIQAVRERDWDRMIEEMLDSKWARQVPNRAKDLIKMVENVKKAEKKRKG